MKPSLTQKYKERFPNLVVRTSFLYTNNCDTMRVKFKNLKCTAWIQEYYGAGFIVGINFLHGHFDYDKNDMADRIISMEDALDRFNEIIQGRYVAYFKHGREEIAMTKAYEPNSDKEEFPPSKYEIIFFE